MVEDLGFASYTLIDVGTPGDEGRFLIATRDRAWDDEYRSNGLIDVAPVISRALRANMPFSWSDVALPAQAGVRKPVASRLMDAARDHGLQNGFVVPFHLVDRIGRSRAMLATFFCKDARSRYFGLMQTYRSELHLLVIYLSQRALDIHVAQIGRREHGVVEASPAGLTDRERVILAWAARGKTGADTGSILGISAETVEVHVRNAMRKPGASNKTHATVLAIKAGPIEP